MQRGRKTKTKQSLKTGSKRQNPPASYDLDRISNDITALRTALNMQAALLRDIEQTLHLTVKEPLICAGK